MTDAVDTESVGRHRRPECQLHDEWLACDGLTGLPEAVTAAWPDTIVQTHIVHLTRASLRWVNYKDRSA